MNIQFEKGFSWLFLGYTPEPGRDADEVFAEIGFSWLFLGYTPEPSSNVASLAARNVSVGSF